MEIMYARPWLLAHPRVNAAIKRGLRASYRHQRRFIPSRSELPFVLNAMRLTGTGAEIGVHAGTFSARILATWSGQRLYSIDPWLTAADDLNDAGVPIPQYEHEALYDEAVRALAPFGTRSTIVRARSLDAARTFTDHALDFCYLDARHEYEHIAADLDAWYPKVKPGGVFAGHDYFDGMLHGVHYGVKRAVDAFARSRGVRTIVSHEPGTPSWFLFL